jgi:two-component system, cell cycle sensor histidine kinase and response regulator CckA
MKNRDLDLERIFDGTDLLFYIADLNGKILYISNAGAKLLGKDRDALFGRNIFNFFPPNVAERRLSILSNIFKTLEPLSFFDERDGRFFKTMAYPILDENGKLKQIAAYVQDLTEIKHAERRLEELKKEMESTIKCSPAHVFRFRKDSQGNIVAVLSEGLIADRFGITTKAIKDRNLLELFGRENFNRILPFYEKSFRGEQVSFEICLRDAWFQTTIAPFKRDEKGIILEVIGYSMDLTIVRKAREELERAEKLESLGTLAGGIAHDFNNLLGGLFGFIDLARVSIHQDVSAKEYIDSAMRCFSRAKDLTQQLLTFARGGAPQKKKSSLEPLIQESIELALSGSTIRCEKDIQKDLFSIEADHGQMNQVFNNVLLNARQAMPNGGVIKIEACNETMDDNEIGGMPAGEYVHIKFIDQGTGIPRDVLPKVFDPFYTTKQAGSGLGLATSYSIIRRHDGHIGIESECGKGTTVNILLPAVHDVPCAESADSEPILRGKGRILLMDDEEVIRTTASEMLKITGYDVVCVKNGEQAIEAYTNAIKEGARFDAVILDLTVVDGMGGEMAVKRLKEIDSDVKAIVSSGYSDSPVLANPKEYGFSAKIAKPYQRIDILKALSDPPVPIHDTFR